MSKITSVAGENITTVRIAELMREQGLKQADLADGMDLADIAQVLGVTVDYLEGITDCRTEEEQRALKAEVERKNAEHQKAKQEAFEAKQKAKREKRMATGACIRKARESCGMTQKALAERIGVASSMIGQWENGNRMPKICTLSKIAAACNTSVLVLTREMDDAIAELESGAVLAALRATDALTVKKALSLLREAVTLLESLS